MTNEEAIKEIRRWIYNCPYSDTVEAFDIAIEALKENEKLSLLYSDMANEIARLKSITGER